MMKLVVIGLKLCFESLHKVRNSMCVYTYVYVYINACVVYDLLCFEVKEVYKSVKKKLKHTKE